MAPALFLSPLCGVLSLQAELLIRLGHLEEATEILSWLAAHEAIVDSQS
ncbi:hypothetical protein ACWGKK_36570 [Streptomyces chartreusis]